MRIFDNILLSQYLDVGAKVQVYANSEWYNITDKSDVSDSIDAVGYDEYGKDHRFSYQEIEQIKYNGTIVTLEMLATKMGDKPDGGDGKKENTPSGGDSEETPPDDAPPEEDKPNKGPDLSWFSPAYDIGRILMKEKEERKKRGNKI